MASLVAVVASGALTSSAVTLFPVDGRKWAIYCPSMSGSAVSVAFSVVSGGAGDFGALYASPVESTVIASSTVRPAWATFTPPTPFCRISLGAPTTDTTSLAYYPVAR